MSRLQLLKYGSALVTTGLTTTLVTRNTIFTDSSSDERDPDDKKVEDSFDSFKKLFYWSKKDDENTRIAKDSPENGSLLINELKQREQYQAPKYPIVLCHGLSGFDRLILVPSLNLVSDLVAGKHHEAGYLAQDKGGVALDYWFGIRDALEARGSTVIVAKVPGFGSIEDRAAELNRFISRATGKLRDKSESEIYHEGAPSGDSKETDETFEERKEKVKVNLIAHSMGGLDSRYLISKIENKNFEVVSLTTITTPHHGSEVADHLVELSKNVSEEYILPPSIYQLTTSYLKEFNKNVPNNPKVQYMSYGASFVPKWYNVFYATWKIIHDKAGANDGMVSVESAKWGVYLGTLVNVDHLDLINWTNGFKRIMTKILPGADGPQIDSVALYLDIADNLAKRGL